MVIISRNHLRNVIQQIRNGRAIFEYILGSDCLAKKNEKLGKSSEMGFSISKLKWVRFLYVSSSNIASEKGVYNKNSVGQKKTWLDQREFIRWKNPPGAHVACVSWSGNLDKSQQFHWKIENGKAYTKIEIGERKNSIFDSLAPYGH